MDQKNEFIDSEATRLRDIEYNKQKEEQEAAFTDLQTQRDDEESQVESLRMDVEFWKNERFEALKIEDYELFTEYEANMKAAQKNLDAAQAKFEITDGKFEIEKAIKETRDL